MAAADHLAPGGHSYHPSVAQRAGQINDQREHRYLLCMVDADLSTITRPIINAHSRKQQ